MKKALFVALATLFLGSAVNAGYPYVGLYAGIIDPITGIEGPGGYDHSACSATVSAPYTQIEMWIWWLPDPQLGLTAGEFKIVYPVSTYVSQGAVTCNPSNYGLCCCFSLAGGVSFSVGGMNCQYDWYYSHHQTLTILKTAPGALIQIVADPALVTPPFDIIMTTCELGFPIYACTKLNDLALNQSCNVAVQDKSWGAIKSLYNE